MRVFEATHTGLPSIVTDVIPVGVAYSLTGEAAGRSWVVAEGVGSGARVSVSDPAAPLDVPTVYTLAPSGVQAWLEHERVTGFGVDTVLCSEDGRLSVAATWEGDAAMSWSPGASYVQPIGRRAPAQFRPLVAGGSKWALSFRVKLAEVETARRVLESGRAWVLHSAARCDGGSTLPPVMLAGIDGDVSEGAWPLGRTYSASLRQLDHGVTGVPLITHGEAAAVWSPQTTFARLRRAVGGP